MFHGLFRLLSMSTLRALLSHVVDYAGLFPPAGLPLDRVCKNYAKYVQADDRWMLARVIVPALKLERLVEIQNQSPESVSSESHDSPPADPWLISALLPKPDDEHFRKALEAISHFNSSDCQRSFQAVVDTVEVAAPRPADITKIAQLVPKDISAFIELPHAAPDSHFETLAGLRSNRSTLFAKIRTGGVTEDLIPSLDQVADFILTAKRFGVGFKATAGLHHPLRNEFALSYEADSPRATMHGFLNVFVAACLIDHQKIDRTAAVELLSSSELAEFRFSDDELSWRECSLDIQSVEKSRGDFAVSFGSCSFEEPLQDLREAKLL